MGKNHIPHFWVETSTGYHLNWKACAKPPGIFNVLWFSGFIRKRKINHMTKP